MRKIEVAVLHEAHDSPAGMMLFLAKLTQRGHKITDMATLKGLYDDCCHAKQDDKVSFGTLAGIANLPHGTIKRFAPITIAIVGASRRFLAQARTNQVGINYVSASLQYSDYSGGADFVVPYAITKYDIEQGFKYSGPLTRLYLMSCEDAMGHYKSIAEATDNDTAGYAAPQGLRNILIMQANHESWSYFIRLRACNRNTNETQFVTCRIWEELLKTADGQEMFNWAGPDCCFGKCREGKMSCGKPLRQISDDMDFADGKPLPSVILDRQWPLLRR